ncbi:hemerythrin domain-containing protein [Aquabacterium sp.]|uniref:hemerythrin domain-containing protein n=1 Tax=Aquabacterium sp. TaxID=1872578 RepID=UPI002E333121|nr:hemerythrin domain-containing protein [Aquabacterium sp.]HEX5313032.1 hemerythrin domain-containing protein [Aquabacterium sp.]
MSTQTNQAGRLNLYQSVHKGLRAFMADTVQLVGATDPADASERDKALEQVRTLLSICQAHLSHENDFIHVAMERRSPGSARQCQGDHVEHMAHINQLTQLVSVADSPEQRADGGDAWLTLYQELSLFVADNLEHMMLEESHNNQVLWSHYSDEELGGIHVALVSSIPPEEMAIHFRWMIPSLSHPERVAMLGGMQQGMPEPVFHSQMAVAQTLLTPRAWQKLAGALNYQAATHG